MYHPPCDCHKCEQARESRCDRHFTPPKPRPQSPCSAKGGACRNAEHESVLLQKIIGCERRNYPCISVCLKIDELPECAKPPYKLVMVKPSGAQPWWVPLESHLDGRLRIRVYIPISCQVRDACGSLHHAVSVAEAEASLRQPIAASDCQANALYIVPSVRLCCSDSLSECPIFEANLEICMNIYAIRPEPCYMRKAAPPCPELPLYPQPVKPQPSWPQCQAVPVPYGWQAQGLPLQ